jgi:protein polybromo-1
MEEEEGEPDEEDEEDEEVAAEEEEEDEDTKYADVENPMWLLYEAIGNYVSSSGKNIIEPFRRLPSKRYYPDYYKEIKNPISLAQIQKKIQVRLDLNEPIFLVSIRHDTVTV